MIRFGYFLMAFILSGCAQFGSDKTSSPAHGVESLAGASKQAQLGSPLACRGTTQPPKELAAILEPAEDEALLKASLGEPEKGGLCQGKVYRVKSGKTLTLYRAWNSTNPNSELGRWWAFNQPDGRVAQYREDYEICYQWSPLDKLSRCEIQSDTLIVVGTGQSAKCSEYLTYAESSAQQIFIDDSKSVAANCSSFDLLFKWQ